MGAGVPGCGEPPSRRGGARGCFPVHLLGPTEPGAGELHKPCCSAGLSMVLAGCN